MPAAARHAMHNPLHPRPVLGAAFASALLRNLRAALKAAGFRRLNSHNHVPDGGAWPLLLNLQKSACSRLHFINIYLAPRGTAASCAGMQAAHVLHKRLEDLFPAQAWLIRGLDFDENLAAHEHSALLQLLPTHILPALAALAHIRPSPPSPA